MAKSLRSSANSRTALLEMNRANGIGYNGTPSHSSSHAQDPPRPQRKQRRVRDPYAIDSDSDEDLEVGASSATKRGEESLVDFLRNVPAPVSPTKLQSAFDDIEEPRGNTALRKASAPSVNSRPTRLESASGKSLTVRNPSAGTSVSQGTTATNPSQSSSFRQRATSDNLPSWTSPGSNTSNGVGPNYATHVDRGVAAPARAPQRSAAPLQARSGRMNNERSNDLADFLKNSEPPPTTQSYAPSFAKEQESGFTRMFTRRKKSVGLVH